MFSKQHWTTADIPDLSQCVAVVTGANSGIGFATAQALAQHGATVVLACRSAQRGRAAAARIMTANPRGTAHFLPLDLADLKSVHAFALEFPEHFSQLDLLVNNAGIMHAPYGETVDGFERHFGVNFLGHFTLTGLLLPYLLESPADSRVQERKRIISVSSLAHLIGRLNLRDLQGEQRFQRIAAYAQSKLALLIFSFELARRLVAIRSNLISVAAHPGWSGTNLHARMPFVRFVNPLLSQTPAMGALPVLYAATHPGVSNGAHYGPGGWFELRGHPRQVRSSRHARDPAIAAQLWQRAQELTGVRFPTLPDPAAPSDIPG